MYKQPAAGILNEPSVQETGMNDRMKYCPLCGGGLEYIEEDGRERAYCRTDRRFFYDNPVPAATSIILDGEGRILLVLRNREPGKNEWALPGGFVETGESPVEAARRELEEETGITASDPVLIDVVYQESMYYGTSLLIIGYHFGKHAGIPRAGDDAEDARFFPVGDLPRLAFESHEHMVRCFLEK